MKYLKEYWRIIKIYYPALKFLRKFSIYLAVTSIISTLILNLSALDAIQNIVLSTLACLLLDVIAALFSPIVLFYKVRKQTKKLLNQKLPNNFKFDYEGMYFWDVEKINKLKVQNEKSIPTST